MSVFLLGVIWMGDRDNVTSMKASLVGPEGFLEETEKLGEEREIGGGNIVNVSPNYHGLVVC